MRDGVDLVDRFEYVEAFIKADSSAQPDDFIFKNFVGFMPMMARILTAYVVNARVVDDKQGSQGPQDKQDKYELLNERFYAAMQDAATMFLNNVDPAIKVKSVVRSESQPTRSERVEMLPRSVSAPARQENKVPPLNIGTIVEVVKSAPSSAQVSDRGSVSSDEEAPKKAKPVENPNGELLAALVAKNDRPVNVAVLKKLPTQPTFGEIYARCGKIIASMKLLNKDFNKSGRVNTFTGQRTKQNVYSLLLTNYILSHTKNVTPHYAFTTLAAVGKVLNGTLSELFPHDRATLALTPEEVKFAHKKGLKPVIRLIPQYISDGDNFSYLECSEELDEIVKMPGYDFSSKNPPIRAFSINKESDFVFVVLRDGDVECIEVDNNRIYRRALPDVVYELLPAGAGSNEFESVIGRQLNGL